MCDTLSLWLIGLFSSLLSPLASLGNLLAFRLVCFASSTRLCLPFQIATKLVVRLIRTTEAANFTLHIVGGASWGRRLNSFKMS